MKNNLTLLAATLLLCLGVFAQAPEKINYQAVARNLSGAPLINQSITVEYEIRSGSSTGTVVYAETHTISTNQFGLFTAQVGGGTPTFGTMAGIAWGTNPFYLYVEVDNDPMGVTQLLSVPYALFAKESANGPTGAPGKNSLMNITPEPSGANCAAGGSQIESGLDDNNDGTLQALEVDFTYFVCDGVAGPTGPQGPIGLTGPAGAIGPNGANGVGIDSTIHNTDGTLTIYYSNATSYNTNDLTGPAGAAGTTYFAGNGISLSGDTITNLGDADNNPTNELISLTNLNGNIIEITENGTLHSIDLSSILGASYTQGPGISIAGNIISAIDTSNTNELQTLSISGDTIYIQNGNSVVLPSATETTTTLIDNLDGTFTYTNEIGGMVTFDANINDADADPTNEIQDLSITGDILTITNNGTATNIDLSPYKELPTTASTGDILQWNGSAWIAAIDAVNDADNDPNNEIELPSTAVLNQVLTWNGTNWIAQNPGSGADNWGSQTAITDGLSITGDGTAGNPITLATPIPTNTSDLTNDSGFITNPDDADNDPNNEIELPSTASTGEVLIWNGTSWVAGTSAPDGDGNSSNELQNLSNGGKVGNNQTVNISGGTGATFSVADADSSVTNEIQLLSFSNPNLSLSNGGGSVNLSSLAGTTYSAGSGINIGGGVISAIDNSATNEIQNLSVSGNNLNISGGTGTLISTNTPTTGDLLYWNGASWIANPTPVDNDNQNLSNSTSPGSVTVNITGGASTTFSINDADANPANELITSFALNGTSDSLVIKEAGNNHAVPLSSLSPSSKWTESGGLLYPTTLTNNVGIGTSTPTALLHHNGTLRLDNMSGTAPAIGAVLTSMDAAGNAEWQPPVMTTTYWAPNGSDIYNSNAGNIGVGTNIPAQNLHIQGVNANVRLQSTQSTSAANSLIEFGNTVSGSFNSKGSIGNPGSGDHMEYDALTFHRFTNQGNEHMRLTNSGELLLGNFFPYSQLDVNGQITMRTGATFGYIPVSDNNGTMTWTDIATIAPGATAWTKSGNNIYPTTLTDNIGIGTNTPTEKLHVTNGQIYNNWINTNSNIPNLYIRNVNSGSVPGILSGTLGQVSITTSDGAESKYAVQGNAGGNGGNKIGIYGAAMGLGTNYGGSFSATGGTNNYSLYSVATVAGTSNGTGTYSTVGGTGSGTTYGVYGQNSSSVTGATYAGNFENFNSTGSVIYGIRSSLNGNSGTGGTKYGVRSDVTGTAPANIGGYFSASGGTTNNALQLVDGSQAVNRVLASDAAGRATWTDLAALTGGGSAAWSKSGVNIFPTTLTDKVGIGTNTPNSSLDILYSGTNSNGINITYTSTAAAGANNAIYTRAESTGGGNIFAAYFQTFGSSTSTSSVAVKAFNTATSTLNTGVEASASGAGASTNYGLFASASGASNNWAGYFDQGNVFIQNRLGIGTTSPATILDVANSTLNTTSKFVNSFSSATQKVAVDGSATGGGGGANLGGSFGATGSTGANYGVYANAYGNVGSKTGITSSATGSGTNIGGQFSATSGTNNYAIIVPSGGGDVGIGTSSPLFPLSVETTTALRAGYFVNNSNTASTHMGAYGAAQGTGAGNKRGGSFEAYNGSGENVGVRGYAQGSTSTNYGVYGWSSGAGVTNYGVYGTASGATTNWAGYFASGEVYIQNNLGVGTANPSSPLHVETFSYANGGYFYNGRTTGGNYAIRTLGTSTSGGFNIGIYAQATGTTTTNYGLYGLAQNAGTNWSLYCNGAAYSSSGTWTGSDERLKTNIEEFNGAIDKLQLLYIKTYNFKTEQYKTLNFPTRKQYGLMAQNLEQVFPEMVMESEHHIPNENGDLSDKTVTIKAVNYDQLIPVLIKAVQEQQKMIDDLKKEVDALKNK